MHPIRQPAHLIRQPAYDLKERPFMVIWETTQACDLACKHCRAEARPDHNDPLALTFEDGCRLIDQIESFGTPRPLVVFTGGDPFKREDIFELTKYASAKGLPVGVSPSGTPLLNFDNLTKLKEAGARAISLSLDGSTAEIHDEFRQVQGSYDWVINGWKNARKIGLKLQVNSTVTRYNLDDLPALFALVRELGAMTWSLFFLVPMGRAISEDEISPEDYEAVMNFLYDASKYISAKTTEGHQYKRVVLQRAALEARGLAPEDYLPLNDTYRKLKAGLAEVTKNTPQPDPGDHIRRTPMHINSGDGFVFINLRGDVYPSGYLPVIGGNVREKSLVEIYRESPLFQSLRDKGQLKGRCGECEFKFVCGGSRSRSYAMTGDVLSEEPFCVYEPGSFPFANEIKELELAVAKG
ncbi:TIGR04053 family radical SAM/SPASM domain-containing protein [Candidatus Chlorohelix allophototropha]|uniref:TIGR04053 family radical SAM/SPASM domain-containing protein n=1 Tax=Candidatus Chlorohelix allophototropha TaxID=3003348 RepID=A0ABY9AYR5_9CHLR|nr:TIGR04053 family radical SAM/SPASM domain-containing protein [Chloroflexota bacterium L227-S17]